MSREFLVNGLRTLLTHGHVDLLSYWKDKIAYLAHGYRFKRYLLRLQKLSPKAAVYVFGHSHQAENCVIDGKRYFNPGTTSMGEPPDYKLSFGLLRYSQNGIIEGEIIPLTGSQIRFGKWEKVR